ncbi:MAG: serine/threonine-protein kinase [Pseudomonadota bacterium]
MEDDTPDSDTEAADRWARVWDLFHAALEQPESEREAFIDTASAGDTALRSGVRKLLAAHEPDDSLLATLPPEIAGPDDSDAAIGPQLGDHIGPYTITARIGEGGMGLVFRAQQSEPVKREVALKLLQPGMSTRDVLTRFEAERQALAMMNHASIAKVFDAGATPSGQPFFAMEYVAGAAVTLYCDAQRLDVAARLRLFLDICDGVQHAHQKGIIHRDLKPSNVLVAEDGGQPVAKIIDFGIAKATEQSLSEHTLHTKIGTMIGTPGYMSPEQAAVVDLDVDVRADIYSLGVLLYELLVGVTPFPGLSEARGLLAVQEAIRDEPPQRPARRLLSLTADDRTTLSESRRTRAATLERQLESDVAWIMLKAMEKDRTRRYASAAELANDIRNYLAGLPVVARAPTRRYRVGRFVRRHALAVSLATTAAIATVTVAISMTLQANALRESLQQTELERNRAEQVASFMVNLFEAANPLVSGGEPVTVRGILDHGAQRLSETLGDQPALRARLLATVSESYRVLGGDDNAQQAIALREQALDDLRALPDPPEADVAALLSGLGSVYHDLGDYDAATQYYTDAVTRLEATDEAPGKALADALGNLSGLHADRSDLPRAAEYATRSLALYTEVSGPRSADAARMTQRLAYILHQQREHDRALPMMLDSLDILRDVYGPDHPTVATALNYAATVQRAAGDAKGAQASLLDAVRIYRASMGDAHPFVANTLSNLALAYGQDGQFDAAIDALRDALRIGTENFGAEHPNVNAFRVNLGTNLQDMGRYAEAAPHLVTGLEFDRRDLAAGSPYLIATIDRLGSVRNSLGDYAAADALLREAMDLRREYLGSTHSDTGVATLNLAMNALARGDDANAEALARRAHDIQNGADPVNTARLAASFWGLGRIMHWRGDLEGAREAYLRALAIYGSGDGDSALSEARVRVYVAALDDERGALSAAETAFAEARDVLASALAPGHADLARVDTALGRIRCRQSNGAEGYDQIARARSALASAWGADNWQLAGIDAALADCLAQQGDVAQAETKLTASHAVLVRTLGETDPQARRVAMFLSDLRARQDGPATRRTTP